MDTSGSTDGAVGRSSRRLYAIVADSHGRYPAQAERAVWSLIALAGVTPSDIVVFVVGELPVPVRVRLERQGVSLVRIAPFPGHAYSNRLGALSHLATRCVRGEYDDVVLLDCDVVVVEPPPGSAGGLLAKVVDRPNPPIEHLSVLFADAGLAMHRSLTDLERLPTARANINAGVVVVAVSLLGVLAEEWPRWVRRCLGYGDLLGQKVFHADQIGFAMMVHAEHLPFTELNRRFNFPLHLPLLAEHDCSPAVLHYHRNVDESGRLREMENLSRANDVIRSVNAALASAGMLERWVGVP